MSKILKVVFGIIIMVILAIYFSIHNFTNFSINGFIRDKITNEPIIGAEVILDQNTIITTETGNYKFNDIKKGFHKFAVNKNGYNKYSDIILEVKSDLRKDILLIKTEK